MSSASNLRVDTELKADVVEHVASSAMRQALSSTARTLTSGACEGKYFWKEPWATSQMKRGNICGREAAQRANSMHSIQIFQYFVATANASMTSPHVEWIKLRVKNCEAYRFE
jgi:hypothetical protein